MLLKLRGRSVFGLILTLILSIALVACSAPNPGPMGQASPSPSATAEKQVQETGTRSNTFPPALEAVLRQDLSKRTGKAADQFQVVKTTRQTWPDGCLGLAKPEELCTQMLVDGWLAVLSDGKQQWTYHSDRTGRNFRLKG